MIRIKNVCWTYAGAETPSLRDVTFRLAAGRFVVLCGASGSGKSTLLRLINGLIPHFHEGQLTGSARLNGRDVAASSLAELGRLSGTVLQHPRRQFFTSTMPEEIAFALENHGEEPRAIRAAVRGAIELEQLGSLGGKLSELSGGEQQHVALAAASAHNPAVLLLDEPSSNLSHEAVGRLRESLRKRKEAGVTIVVAEHRLHYLRSLADDFVLMRDGAIDTVVSAAEMWRRDDAELEREGLRATRCAQQVWLPNVAARGPSVAEGVPGPGTNAVGDGISLTEVRCRLGGRRIVDIEEAHLPAGRVSAILGPNGAGKTTLARVLAGLLRHDGSIWMQGRRLRRGQRQRMCAMVMQDVQRQLFTDSAGAELTLGTRLRSDDDRVLDALAAQDLRHVVERHPLSLSGGQQQRLVVAGAQVAGARIAIFDEPSSGVDRRHLDSIADSVRSLARQGAVVLLISHDVELINRAADAQLRLVPCENRGAVAR